MAQLRKDTQNLQSPPGPGEHPLFTGKTTVGMISGENPKFPAQASGHEAMGQAIQQMGLKAEPRAGRYGSPEKSWMVYGPTREQMFQLGQQFGQESVVYSQGGKHELLYSNGPNTGRFHPALDHEWFQSEPEDYYTHMPELGGYLRLNFDWNTLHDTNLHPNAAVAALQTRATGQAVPPQPQEPVQKSEYSIPEVKAALAATLRKALVAQMAPRVAPHPHAYDWHNEHTDHHLHVAAPGVVLRANSLTKAMSAHPHMDGSKPAEGTAHLQSPPANDQAAGVGVSTYAKYAMPYGAVDKQNPTDLFHYPYHGKNHDIDRLVKDHGYSVYYAGGKYGRPDLAARNYNTKHLMVYDPSPGSGGDFGTEAYTDGWRKIHELAHALTYPELNQVYGEGRRIGKLGHHRTMREALRAVHWEWLAAHKQRELSKQIGVNIPDHLFHKELNTVMHDAIHRAVTGKFTEPSGEGFRPHEHKVPLESALGMVREAAHNLGLTGMHDLMKKSEGTTMADDKVYEPQEWRQALAKAIKDRVDAYSKELLALRQRELKKADPALAAAPAPEMNPVDLCPLCGCPDVPGQCKCLQGPLAGPAMGKNEVMGYNNVAKPPAPGMAKAEMCKACGKEHMDKCGLDEIKPGPALDKKELSAKAKEPVKPADGNGIKVKSLKKAAKLPGTAPAISPGTGRADTWAGEGKPEAHEAAAPKPKFGLADLAAGKAKLQAQGVKPASSLAAPKLPGMGAKPAAPAMPPAGTGHLASPPAAAGAPKLPGMTKPAAPAAPTAPAPMAKPALPKPAAPAAAPAAPKAPALGKSEGDSADLKKALGSCALCNKEEHPGQCS
jgi:hypothetical protein